MTQNPTLNPTLNSTPLLQVGDGGALYNNRVPDPTLNPTLNSTPLLQVGDGGALYNNRVPDPKGESVYDFNTKQVHHPFKKIVDKKTKKKIKNREFLKFQKKNDK